MRALLLLVVASEPVLGPRGWTWLGPLPPGRDEARDTVVLDPRTCAPAVARVWLDGGAEHRDVRLARVWDGGWRWADDWEVRAGVLARPGRADVPLGPDRRVEGEVVEVDAAGRVVARVRGTRRVEILRDGEGAFAGMRSERVSVKVEATATGGRGVASDGRSVGWRVEDGALRSFTDEAGVTTVYDAGGGTLSAIRWADGSGVVFEADARGTRVRGAGSTWSCVRAGDRATLTGPSGAWVVEQRPDGEVVSDPATGVVQLWREGGRVAGWADPRSGRTRVERDGAGRVAGVTDPSGARWAMAWGTEGLVSLTEPPASTWTLGWAKGLLASVTDAAGRVTAFERDAAGRVRGVRRGAATRAYTRDAAGRVVEVRDPTGSTVMLRRDERGRVVRVLDGAGGAWVLERDAGGRVAAVADPGGARWVLARDRLGRVAGVTDPTGRVAAWTRRDDGRVGLVRLDGRRWELLWSSTGALSAVRDPLGRPTGFLRDALGRVTEVLRADASSVAVRRDAAGDVVEVGGAGIARDGAGRALSVGLAGGGAVAWDRDGGGRVVGIAAPGIDATLLRDAAGQIREVRVDDAATVRITRDAAGRVIEAGDTRLTRDGAGRVTGVGTAGRPPMRVDRDVRGLEARVAVGERAWTIGRDAAGRALSVAGPDGVALGVDRDAAGRVRLVRFPGGALARIGGAGGVVEVELFDPDGGVEARTGWSLDDAGRLDRVRGDLARALRRDPLGALVAVEAEAFAWSLAPDGIEGPGGARLAWDLRGRPREGVVPAGHAPAWSVATGAITYVTSPDGALREVIGERGRSRLVHDGVGRLVSVSGPDGVTAIVRDGLGRLARVGEAWLEGWNALLTVAGQARAPVSGVGLARPGGGLLLDPRGTPALAVHAGALESAPGGLPGSAAFGESGAGERFQPWPGGPLLGLVDALDPVSGQPTGPALRWPWEAAPWEAGTGGSPWAEPDAAATGLPWDPAPWSPESPWSRPLDLLVEIGELPDGGPRSAPPPGLPWLPASLAPAVPSPLPDPDAVDVGDEPVVAWVVARALPPVRAAEPGELAALLLAGEIARELRLPPGLAPALPAELR
ncbi:MAG: hypothetical protein ACOZNI_03495 [Myxococcota bacterium]